MTSFPVPPVSVVARNNVRLAGDPAGRPMMFAHGFGCSQEMWDLVSPAFADDHRLILFDYVGAGGSDLSAYDPVRYDSLLGYATDVIEILDELGMTDVVFVGHSVSSMIGALAAIRRPDLFAGIVMVGPSPRYLDDGDYRGGFGRADIDSLLEAVERNYLGWSAAMGPVIAGNPGRPDVGARLTDSFCAWDPVIAAHFARVTFLSDNREDLPRLTTPTLVLQCSDDVIAPEHVGEYVHRSIPSSSLVHLQASGHCPHLSAPAEVVAAIRAFLA